MPNVEKQKKKTIEFSPIGNVDETTNNPPETIKDVSQTKRTSFTDKFGSNGRNETKRKRGGKSGDRKSKIFGTVTAITTETRQDKEQVTQEATAN